ncbi:MAG: amino acid ABC transporter permease [Clostridiales bacterium]|nr:amino acid ABC transporter permease [Clostridiales bacterium]
MQLYIQGFLVALKGVPMTLGVSLFAVAVGAAFGLCLALMRISQSKVLAFLAKIYVDIVRGTPLVVQALIFAYGLPQLLQASGIMFKWSSLLLPAMLVCAFNSSAYLSEVIRGGIQAVEHGQMEAARSLGMSKSKAMRLVIMPQAIKIILPAFGNEFVALIKETAVLSYVGIVEILRRGTLWNAATFETFPAYIGVALVYMLLTIPLSKTVGYFEKKMSEDDTHEIKAA